MPAPIIRRDGKKAKILYVEDNRENRMLVRAILEADGYTIVDAEDGLSGVEAAVREEPALILLDVNLPGIDGYEVVAVLKSFPALANTPVVALTAYAMEGDRQRTLVAGCDGYIQKPIDVDTFPRQVEEFLHGKREHVEEREEGAYLRELNQRLVHRLVNQVEELKRLNQHFVRRATQLADLHRAVQDITSEVGARAMLDQLLPALSHALGTRSLSVELPEADVKVAVTGDSAERPRSVLAGTTMASGEDWTEVDWTLPLAVRGRPLGVMTARHVLPPGAKADEEQLLNIVANQVAIAVENARLYSGAAQRAAEQQSLVEAGHLLASSLRLTDVLQRFTELVRSRIDLDVVRIWLHEGPGEYRLHAQAGLAEQPGDRRGRFEPGEGIVGWVMEHLAPLVIADLPVDPRLKERQWAKAEGLMSLVAVPLLLEDAPVGVLVGLSRQRREFASEEVALVQALATSAAVAIRNARLYEETQRRLRYNETLVSVSQAIGSTLDLTDILRRSTREMVRGLGGDMGVAWLLSPDRSRFVPLGGYHIPKNVLGATAASSLPLEDPVVKALKAAKGPLAATDSQAEAWSGTAAAQVVAHKSMLIQPIFWKDDLIGGFSILWLTHPHRFATEELRLAEGIALQGALAIENARLYEGVKQQMAELKQTQAQLVQSTKLAAIGELAANIAHEINNPLTTVLGFASFIAERLSPDDPTREELGLIQEEASRARDIVRDLLQFSRQRDFMPEPSDVNMVLEQVVAMVRRQGALNGITATEAYGPDLPMVEMDVPRIKQVFLNIINNAVYAMKNGGSLTLRSTVEGTTVRIAFEDTGPGIPAEVLGRIFDPFFTTKPEVSGTGLGLSVSLGIVQSHGGTIDVRSELGAGTTFTVTLPITHDAPAADA
ncbi:MAG TPA: GAF domain-containing protein [Candidatus Acidoferrum sp.]|jgi:signal transduction histidine kinase/DNA-binding response OmpR family regulator|nr:GAF domain-containing protein [Candidatus Acidoferrum sp.]